MGVKKWFLFLMLAISMSPIASMASHYMGGEIMFECLPNGNYRFIMNVYRECHGITYPNTISLTTNATGISSITLNLYPDAIAGRLDLSPDCNINPSFPHLNCTPSPALSNTGSVEEWHYTSDQTYPNGVSISGVPPVSGWYFSYVSSARNPSTNLVGLPAFCLSTYMFPYNNTNAHPCFDNSPRFAEKPPTVMVNGYKTTYNSNAFDPEGDSLHFEWAAPYSAINTPITAFSPGYSYTSPLPSATQNITNIAATIDPYTGQISYLSNNSGAFVTNFVAQAFRNGILVSQVQRELQVVLVSAIQANTPPFLYAPFPQNTWDMYSDTVDAGEMVTFTLHAKDYNLTNDSSHTQTISFTASGALFGNGFISPTAGCLEPPCATLNPPPPDTATYNFFTTFNWQTECNHISFGNGNLDNMVDYYFVFDFKDDFCAVPGFTMKTVKLVIRDPKLPAPQIWNVTTNATNGDVTVKWTPVTDPLMVFKHYDIYYKTGYNEPWQYLDSVKPVNQFQYIHIGANGNAVPLWYKMKTRSGCTGSQLSGFGNTWLSPSATLWLSNGQNLQPDIQMFVESESGAQNLMCSSPSDGKILVQIMDQTGRVVYDFTEAISGGNTLNKIALPNLTSGVYFFRGLVNGFSKTGKFVVVK